MRQGEQPAVGQTVLLRRGWFQGADKPALRDTFGEWRRCKMNTGGNTGSPNMANSGRPNGAPPTGAVDFEITPNGGGQASPINNPQYYPPQTTTSYPQTTTSYPQTTTSYPSTDVVTYPTTSETYPSSNPYPSNPYPATRPSTTTRPQAPSAGKPTTSTTRPQAPPAGRPTTTTTAPRPTAPTATGTQYHTVEVKQTLWAISRIYGTTVDRLKQLNNLPNNDIKPGQQLRVR